MRDRLKLRRPPNASPLKLGVSFGTLLAYKPLGCFVALPGRPPGTSRNRWWGRPFERERNLPLEELQRNAFLSLTTHLQVIVSVQTAANLLHGSEAEAVSVTLRGHLQSLAESRELAGLAPPFSEEAAAAALRSHRPNAKIYGIAAVAATGLGDVFPNLAEKLSSIDKTRYSKTDRAPAPTSQRKESSE